MAEVLQSSLNVIDVIVADDWFDDQHIVALANNKNVVPRMASVRAVERIATTSSPQPVVAEVELPDTDRGAVPLPAQGASAPLFIVAVDVNDPGNLGTVARSAVAVGFDAVIALGDTADPFGPKAVRSSAGALFHVPVVIERSVADGMNWLAELGVQRIGTRMTDAAPCDLATLDAPLALVLGNEAHGLGSEIEAMIDTWVSVPMTGSVESLNVAMAGTILSYEVARQRRSRM